MQGLKMNIPKIRVIGRPRLSYVQQAYRLKLMSGGMSDIWGQTADEGSAVLGLSVFEWQVWPSWITPDQTGHWKPALYLPNASSHY